MAHKAEILSDAEVDFLMTAEKAAAPLPTPGGEDQAVTMRGDLEQINLADIFQTLAIAKMEGVLRIRNPLEERQVHVRDGFLRAHVPGRLATRRLGQRLVQAGLVQVEQLRATLLKQQSVKKPLGTMLVDDGLVSQQDIDDIIGRQVAEDVFALFTWRHGTFEFWKGEPNEATKEQFANCPEYEVNSLLLEVARRSDEWADIHSVLGCLDDVPQVIRDIAADEELEELHRELLSRTDGKATYRDLADQTTHGLFEVARAARDLVRSQTIANIDEVAMVELAKQEVDTGRAKRAIVLLQTLRDRPGERSIEILQDMAAALEKSGEKRLAGNLLLEAAQRHADGDTALTLARTAHALVPHDVGTLSFLRTVLVAHAPAGSPELEKCTLDLLDALVEADLVPTALEIIEDARRTGPPQAAILMREARARQKSRDVAGAAAVLEELARLHDSLGQAKQALEAYDALLRLDRSRKDIQKLVIARRRTRVGRIVRVCAFTVASLILGVSGTVIWRQHAFSNAVTSANHEITSLLQANDRRGARERLAYWQEQLGECEATNDLQSRIAFADAAEAGREQKLLRTRLNTKLGAAAEHLAAGDLDAALAIYVELANEDKARAEATEVAHSRIDSLIRDVTAAGKGLQSRSPSPAKDLVDRQDVLRNQGDLQAICTPMLLTLFEQLDAAAKANRLPALLGPERIESIRRVTDDLRQTFRNARTLADGYAAALARDERQRALDPLFKLAVDRERELDFSAALEHFRELERQAGDNNEMRAHFRDRVARCATIVRLLEALRTATAAGDFPAAQQQLRALRLSFPGVPFDRVAALPLRLDSRPTGARVSRDGVDVGATPMTISRLPSQSVRITIEAEGFRSAETTIHGDEPGAWFAQLVLPPRRAWQHANAIETHPLATGMGPVFVDRAGDVVALDRDGKTRWRYHSGDLSGLLTAPLLHEDTVLVASLDGELRAFELTHGTLRWSQPDLPTELTPVLVGNLLCVATNTKRLCTIDLGRRQRTTVDLPASASALIALGNGVAVLGEHGLVTAFDLTSMKPRWSRETNARTAPQACLVAGVIAVIDEHGQACGLDANTGEVRWRREVPNESFGPPIGVGNHVWVATRSQLLRLDAANGKSTAILPPDDGEWCGPPAAFGDRVLVPVRNGLQVIDPAAATQLYRLSASRRAAAHVVDRELWVTDADRSIQIFDRLR